MNFIERGLARRRAKARRSVPTWPHPEGPRRFRHSIAMLSRWLGEDARHKGELTRRGRKARARARREVVRIGTPMPKALQ